MGNSKRLKNCDIQLIYSYFEEKYKSTYLKSLSDLCEDIYQRFLSLTGLDLVMKQFSYDDCPILWGSNETTDLYLYFYDIDGSLRYVYLRHLRSERRLSIFDCRYNRIGLKPDMLSESELEALSVLCDRVSDYERLVMRFNVDLDSLRDRVYDGLKGKTFAYLKRNWVEAYDLVSGGID